MPRLGGERGEGGRKGNKRMPIVRGERMKAAEWGRRLFGGEEMDDERGGEERRNRKDNCDLFYLQLNVYSQ